MEDWDDSNYQLNDVKFEGGQSTGLIYTDQKTKQVYFKKIFDEEIDYVREKAFYKEILIKIDPKDRSSFLELLHFNDNNKELIFPFINSKLVDKCTKQKGIKSRYLALKLFHLVVEKIKILHSKNICHCDIKVHNILLVNVQDKENYKVIIIDFGQYQELNRKSTMNCGTTEFNPPKLIEDADRLKKFGKQIEEYSPQELDVYQLGMLLFRMLTQLYLSISLKKVAQNKMKKDFFKEQIKKLYKSEYKTELILDDDIFDLVFQILSREITEINQIQQHQIYQQYLQGKIKPDEEDLQFEDMVKFKEDQNSSRSKGESIQNEIKQAHKKYCDLMRESENFDQFNEWQGAFFKLQPRKIDRKKLYGGSLLTEMSTEDLLNVLLSILAENNNQIFSQNIFRKGKDSLTLEVELNYQTVEIDRKYYSEQLQEDEEDLDELIESNRIEKIKMQIEVVSVIEQGKPEMRSLIFQSRDGEKIYYDNLIQEIQEKIYKF
ncbi:kinase domain protein (macronuclear) [Tetrahymena thermophila SB210]|uniref:Kinase domain protein n=1 Tax=Tetrahymena thermophila (strain SB210) TaxID=312017 RepID=I7LV21_TETTS|nr:kinase domain protein [Tetrahymena thermophila SB210]EAR96496.2 kinase domain protein [Tetrahymena thermophila SB210]|eukprot:XP_001016741.2 kinase domain protein [Tetrahymena thermophila SB210]